MKKASKIEDRVFEGVRRLQWCMTARIRDLGDDGVYRRIWACVGGRVWLRGSGVIEAEPWLESWIESWINR